MSEISFVSSPKKFGQKESNYIHARSIEGRVLSNDEVAELPNTASSYLHHHEWNMRKRSYLRLQSLVRKTNPKTLLDIGCGNGWLIGNLTKQLPDCKIDGVDLNRIELEQANEIFGTSKTNFYYLDLMEQLYFEPNSYEMIIFNASIQYFENLSSIVSIAKTLLKDGGIIIINDSPFYQNEKEAKKAVERSSIYYQKLGVPEMATSYFHHLRPELAKQGFKKHLSLKSLFLKYPFSLYYYIKP